MKNLVERFNSVNAVKRNLEKEIEEAENTIAEYSNLLGEKIRINEVKIDENKEIEKLIKIETNRQLNQFSRIYFDKAKINYSINEN